MAIARSVVAMFSIGLLVLGHRIASGQDYPNKPVRIVTSGVGGGSDFVSRQIAQGLTGPLGQSVIVDNRGGGIIQGETVARAPPDGYTLLVQGAALWVTSLIRKTSYDPVRDFSPITLVASAPIVLVVTPSLPAKSVKELIALAKARPRELNYVSSTAGTSSHLAAELFNAMAGVKIVRINYKGVGQSFNDLISGQVQMTFDAGSALMGHIKSGKLRALAVTSAEPSALFPDLPTVAASVPGYESVSITGVWAPAKTPETIINRLNQEIVRVLRTKEIKEIFLNVGVEPVSSSPEQFMAIIKSDMARTGKLIKDLGIRED